MSPAPLPRRDDPRMHTVEMAALSPADLAEDGGGRRRRPAPLTTRQTAALVAAGGALGAVLRFVLQLLLPSTIAPTLVEIPWATWIANAVGCLGAGMLTGVIEVHPHAPRWLEPFAVLGLCGAFTTASTVVLQVGAMIGADFPLVGLEYGIATVVIALGAVVLGIAAGRLLGKRVRA